MSMIEPIKSSGTKTRGRPKLSTSHKKCVRKEYLENKKKKKIEEGTYRPPGRPRKVSE